VAIQLAVQMAESEARRMLALKTQQATGSAGAQAASGYRRQASVTPIRRSSRFRLGALGWLPFGRDRQRLIKQTADSFWSA
jgi:hypothetical protein